MADYQKEIDNLYQKLNEMEKRHLAFSMEINDILSRINSLQALIRQEKRAENTPVSEVQVPPVITQPVPAPVPVVERKPAPVIPATPVFQSTPKEQVPASKPAPVFKKDTRSDSSTALEKYIGQNLIPVIGIIITVIGVGIGAKYAIDRNLIQPWVRILIGYLIGGGLFFFAARFKKKYHDFSAVLLSGSMAIFYFVTYMAYSLYHLIPLEVTFPLMVVFTGFTVYSAIKYDKQLIAHIGLIGAYAVPFLVNNNSGRIGVFFSYMSIINIGILAVAFFRSWRLLFYTTFALTWFIFLGWLIYQFDEARHLGLALAFLSVFFAIFYATDLVFKRFKEQVFDEIDVVMILANAVIFYGAGCFLVNTIGGATSVAWFTLLNAAIHGTVSGLVYLAKIKEQKLQLLTTCLALFFVTIFMPIKFHGIWLMFAWLIEAVALFWIGRTKGQQLLNLLSYPILILSFICLVIDWNGSYMGTELKFSPFVNTHFLQSLIFLGTLIFIYLNTEKVKPETLEKESLVIKHFARNIVYVLILAVIFFSVQLEITHYWNMEYMQSLEFASSSDHFTGRGNPNIWAFAMVTKILYSLVFLSVFAFIYRKRQRTEEFNILFSLAFGLGIFAFLTIGLYKLNFLHLQYLWAGEQEIFYHGFGLVAIRYFSFAVLGAAVYQMLQYIKTQMPGKSMQIISEYLFHTVIVWCASAELVNWMHTFHSDQAYKLGLSIFAGLYSLFMIVLGIWKKKNYLRIGAFSLFGVTLLKLFLYDISQLDTIFKTVIFISLGILLLIIAFLYNKYKGAMFGEEDDEKLRG